MLPDRSPVCVGSRGNGPAPTRLAADLRRLHHCVPAAGSSSGGSPRDSGPRRWPQQAVKQAGRGERRSRRLSLFSGQYRHGSVGARTVRAFPDAGIPHTFFYSLSAHSFFFFAKVFFLFRKITNGNQDGICPTRDPGKCTTPLEYGFNTATTHGIKLVKKLVALSSSVPAGRGLAIGMYPIARGLLCAGGPHSRDGALWLIDGSYSQSVAHHLASI